MNDETALVPHVLPDIRDLLAGRLSPNTIRVYREDITMYMEFAQEHDLQQFDSQTLALWRDDMILNSEKSPNTINRQLAAIRRTIKEAASRRMVSGDVAYQFANVESVSVRALRSRLKKNGRERIFPEQMRKLCDTPDVSTLVGLRDRALLHTLASSGLRISEALDLTSEMIEQRGTYYILSVIGKTDIEAREAHLSAEAKAHIDAWLAARPVPSPYIFTQFDGRGAGAHHRLSSEPLSRIGAWDIIRKYARGCGLTHFHPHSFRAFVATELSSRDIVKAQKALGHSNINTTARYYVLSGIAAGETDNLY
jgi:integrase/recombinase XerD